MKKKQQGLSSTYLLKPGAKGISNQTTTRPFWNNNWAYKKQKIFTEFKFCRIGCKT